MFRIAFLEPRIAPNTGNAIRLAAGTGCELHLIGPLGFELSDAKLRRAGLDYHDLASVTVHADLASAWQALLPARVFAFTTQASTRYTDVAYQARDVLLFGTGWGLTPEILARADLRLPPVLGPTDYNHLSVRAAAAILLDRLRCPR